MDGKLNSSREKNGDKEPAHTTAGTLDILQHSAPAVSCHSTTLVQHLQNLGLQ